MTSLVERATIGEAWLAAMQAVSNSGTEAVEPLVISFTEFQPDGHPVEERAIPDLIDRGLAERDGEPLSTSSTANTIFPQSLWNETRPRTELYLRYSQILPSLRKDPLNRLGIYFERMVAFGRGPESGNQIENLLKTYEAGVRRTSAFQVVITDPERDAVRTRLRGFPCLQQIAVNPSQRKRTLTVTGFYGTQFIFDRAYGNYLGLARLGRFVAKELGLTLVRVTCVAARATIGSASRRDARELLRRVEDGRQ